MRLNLHRNPLENLAQIHGVAKTFASALQAAVKEEGQLQASGGSVARLRRFVLVTLVLQYFGAAAAAHPGYPCLLQLATQFVKLLNTHTVAACHAPRRKRGLMTELSSAGHGGGAGGGGGGGAGPGMSAAAVEAHSETRESELYILLVPLLETICGHGQVAWLLPGKASRGDAYSALKSTLTSLRDIWISQGGHGPCAIDRREVLRTTAKVLSMHCVVDLFEASDPTPNQRQDAAHANLLPTTSEIVAELRRLNAKVRSSVTHTAHGGASVWANFSANLPAIAMCRCDGPRTEAPRRNPTVSTSKVRKSVAQQALATLLQAATLLPETAAEVGAAIPRLHRVGTFETARGSLRAHQSYRAFLVNVGPAGMPYLQMLDPTPLSALAMMRVGRL